MRERFGYTHLLAVPRIEKVVVNVGVGRLKEEKQKEEVAAHLARITGQKLVGRAAKKSIASFKIREGQIVGYTATLRGQRMYDFLTRLIAAALPRTRDFRGLNPRAIDMGGALTLGIRESIVFPEMASEDVSTPFGLEATVVTNAQNREEAEALFRLLGFPLQHG